MHMGLEEHKQTKKNHSKAHLVFADKEKNELKLKSKRKEASMAAYKDGILCPTK